MQGRAHDNGASTAGETFPGPPEPELTWIFLPSTEPLVSGNLRKPSSERTTPFFATCAAESGCRGLPLSNLTRRIGAAWGDKKHGKT